MVGGAALRLLVPALAALMALSGCEGLLGLNDLTARGGPPADGGLEPDGPGANPPDHSDGGDLLSPQPDADAATKAAMDALAEAPALPDAQPDTETYDGSSEQPDTAAEDAADAGAPIPELPAVFVLTGSMPTPTRGGPQTPMDDLCPGNQAVVGYSGTVGNPGVVIVSSLQLVCGAIDVVGSDPSTLRMLPGATLAEQGTPGDSSFAATCPAGQVAVGIHGQSGIAVDQLGFDCAPLTLAPDGTVGVDDSAITSLAAYGGAGGGPFDDTCPSGQIVRGVDIAAGGFLYNISAICAAPSAPACVGDLSGVSTGAFRISFTVETTQAGLVALLNQRATCTLGSSFWDIRLSNGALLVETDDPQAYTSVTALGPAINDGLPHDVVVERLAGNLVVLVDSVQVGSKASAANFGGLPPLVVGADACDADGSTIALVGSLTNLCVAAQ
jgi:hypothetical protein